MRKRLRKKLHKREFKEYGFEVHFKMDVEYESQEFCQIIDVFISQGIEGNGLNFGGGGALEWEGFVSADKGSATEDHRMLLEEWFKKQPLIVDYYVGPLKDAWA